MIAFVGSVFSPYYAWARRRDGVAAVDAENHVALNVSLYDVGPGGRKRWCMTERGRAALQREAGLLRIGPSALRWDGAALCIDIDEVTVPWPSRLRGTVRLQPGALFDRRHALDAAGRHRWGPIAPKARVEVDLDGPGGRWRGDGYLDANDGDEPLEAAFVRWDWSRAHLADGRTAVLYDVQTREGTQRSLAGLFDEAGGSVGFDAPPDARLPRTAWRVARGTRCDAAARGGARVLRTLEDAPFYARSLIESRWLGEPVTAVHESLSLARFDHAVTRLMLPFRMPRRTAPLR